MADARHSSGHHHLVEIHHHKNPLHSSAVSSRKVCDVSGACRLSGKGSTERSSSAKKLWIAVVLCLVFMGAEVVGGIKANSLAILTDAAHLLSDVAALGISLFSLWASGWAANPRQSYGFLRIEILGALASVQMIWLLAGILVYEAVNRFIHGNGEVKGWLMFAVAGAGLLVNIFMAIVLGHTHHHHHDGHGHHSSEQGDDHHHQSHTHHSAEHGDDGEHNNHHHHHSHINVQAAYLHVLGDCIQSIGVMVAGAIVWWKPEWKQADLICTLVFSVIVLTTSFKMLRNIFEVLMESTPREIDATKLEKGLCDMEEVVAVHELHIWAITIGKALLSCHVKITPEAQPQAVLDKVIGYIRKEYKINHVTVQIEMD